MYIFQTLNDGTEDRSSKDAAAIIGRYDEGFVHRFTDHQIAISHLETVLRRADCLAYSDRVRLEAALDKLNKIVVAENFRKTCRRI